MSHPLAPAFVSRSSRSTQAVRKPQPDQVRNKMGIAAWMVLHLVVQGIRYPPHDLKGVPGGEYLVITFKDNGKMDFHLTAGETAKEYLDGATYEEKNFKVKVHKINGMLFFFYVIMLCIRTQGYLLKIFLLGYLFPR